MKKKTSSIISNEIKLTDIITTVRLIEEMIYKDLTHEQKNCNHTIICSNINQLWYS